jgi:hypothetical protein
MLPSEMDLAESDEADFLYVFSDPFDIFMGERRRLLANFLLNLKLHC